MPPPKFDDIIQKCWLDALRMPKMQKPQILIFLRGSIRFPPDYKGNWKKWRDCGQSIETERGNIIQRKESAWQRIRKFEWGGVKKIAGQTRRDTAIDSKTLTYMSKEIEMYSARHAFPRGRESSLAVYNGADIFLSSKLPGMLSVVGMALDMSIRKKQNYCIVLNILACCSVRCTLAFSYVNFSRVRRHQSVSTDSRARLGTRLIHGSQNSFF